MTTQTEYRYVVQERGGEPCLAGNRIPLTVIVAEFDLGNSLTLEHIDNFVASYPQGFITPSMIYESFAYYNDHKNEVDALLTTHSQPPEGFKKDLKDNYVQRNDSI